MTLDNACLDDLLVGDLVVWFFDWDHDRVVTFIKLGESFGTHWACAHEVQGISPSGVGPARSDDMVVASVVRP